jgi:hypothetical protein
LLAELATDLTLGVHRAFNLLLVLASYDAYRELREAGLSDRQTTTLLQQTARDSCPPDRRERTALVPHAP